LKVIGRYGLRARQAQEKKATGRFKGPWWGGGVLKIWRLGGGGLEEANEPNCEKPWGLNSSSEPERRAAGLDPRSVKKKKYSYPKYQHERKRPHSSGEHSARGKGRGYEGEKRPCSMTRENLGDAGLAEGKGIRWVGSKQQKKGKKTNSSCQLNGWNLAGKRKTKSQHTTGRRGRGNLNDMRNGKKKGNIRVNLRGYQGGGSGARTQSEKIEKHTSAKDIETNAVGSVVETSQGNRQAGRFIQREKWDMKTQNEHPKYKGQREKRRGWWLRRTFLQLGQISNCSKKVYRREDVATGDRNEIAP